MDEHKRNLSLDSKLALEEENRNKRNNLKLKTLLRKVTTCNENVNEINEDMNRKMSSLLKLLRYKDEQLKLKSQEMKGKDTQKEIKKTFDMEKGKLILAHVVKRRMFNTELSLQYKKAKCYYNWRACINYHNSSSKEKEAIHTIIFSVQKKDDIEILSRKETILCKPAGNLKIKICYTTIDRILSRNNYQTLFHSFLRFLLHSQCKNFACHIVKCKYLIINKILKNIIIKSHQKFLKKYLHIFSKNYLLSLEDSIKKKSSDILKMNNVMSKLQAIVDEKTFDNKTLAKENENLKSAIINYENDLETVKNEKQFMKSKIETFQSKFSEFEGSQARQKEEEIALLENKAKSIVDALEKVKGELSDKKAQYDNLKKISNESTEELLKTNAEVLKLKSENKTLTEKIKILNEQFEKTLNECNMKERSLKQVKLSEEKLEIDYKNEIDKIETKFSSERNQLKEKLELMEKEHENISIQCKALLKENKALNEKVKGYSDYNSLKGEIDHLRDKVVNYENENTSIKLHSLNLQKQIDKLIESLAAESKKYEQVKLEYEELKALSKESKDDLHVALEEMEGYSNLLHMFEEKIKSAEEDKKQAEKERDDALNDVKTIRQRYINILGDSKAFDK